MDATLKETNIKKSVKKFFVDGLPTIAVYFDREISSQWFGPGPKKWVTVFVEGLTPAHVSEAYMPVYLYTKMDKEGLELSLLRDTVFELLESGSISLYNTFVSPWVKIGALTVVYPSQSKVIHHDDQSRMIVMHNTLKWGAVWS